jgi:uncharacterized membrane protein
MFVPGIAILKLLELKNLDTAEKAIFSIGLSIAFLMFIGLIINEIGRLAFTNPLSLNLLLFSINMAVLLISLIASRHEGSSLPCLPQLKRTGWIFSILLIISLSLLGSYGTVMVIVSGNSFLLLLLIIASSIAVSSVFISEKTSPKLHPWILLVVSFCMIFLASGTLIPKYIGGTGDGPIEFYAFRLTETKGFWDSAATSSPYAWNLFPTYSMLSVTILPMFFSVITGADSSLIFNLIYPFIVAFLALGAYKLYQTQTENKVAFLAAFFFFTISFGKGFGSYKQQIAQLFYILLFLLLFKKDISPSKRSVLFIVFSAGLVMSHYGLTYVLLLTIILAFLILALMERAKTGNFPIYHTKIPLTLVLIFLAITFSWYIFVNSAETFNLLEQEVNTITSNLGQFFNLESRGTALQGLGFVEIPTIYHRFSSALFITTEILLVVGFFKLLTSKNKNSKYGIEYKVIATINMAIIAINILLPRLADTLLMSRFYQTTLIILAPLAVLGGETIIKFIPKLKIQKLSIPLLAIIVFIPLFLFQTGFVYEVAKVKNYSLALSMYRSDDLTLYSYIVNAQEVTGAQWLQKHSNTTSIFIYSDDISRSSVLTGYGMLERGRVYYLSNSTKPTSNEFIYLSNVNLISKGYIFNATEISPILESQNKIYSNGECEIYKGYTP